MNEILQKQREQQVAQQFQQKIQSQSGKMNGEANQLLQGWQKVAGQGYVAGTPLQEKKQTIQTKSSIQHTKDASSQSQDEEGGQSSGGGPQPAIKAGAVLFAVLDTSVDSDQPGPVLATIVVGRLKGAKLIGSFSLVNNSDKMTITFNQMSVKGAANTISINAYAIDPNTARTALSSRTDHHYLMRYGSLFAATFIEGFGNAFQAANTTVSIGGTGGVTNTTISSGVGRSTLENAVIGLSTLGKQWGQVAMQNVSTPTTVEVFGGTGIGVLFMQNVAVV